MFRTTVDLNCDMGEGFGHWTYGDAPDADLMPLISSANVAAGFHAGDPNQMDAVVRLASEHGVGLGAHPGYNDLQGFGRRTIAARPEDAELAWPDDFDRREEIRRAAVGAIHSG